MHFHDDLMFIDIIFYLIKTMLHIIFLEYVLQNCENLDN